MLDSQGFARPWQTELDKSNDSLLHVGFAADGVAVVVVDEFYIRHKDWLWAQRRQLRSILRNHNTVRTNAFHLDLIFYFTLLS